MRHRALLYAGAACIFLGCPGASSSERYISPHPGFWEWHPVEMEMARLRIGQAMLVAATYVNM